MMAKRQWLVMGVGVGVLLGIGWIGWRVGQLWTTHRFEPSSTYSVPWEIKHTERERGQ